MELRHLRILVEVLRCNGFSAAAKQLGSTQSTVSKAIHQLEHDFGSPLLDRLPGGVKATEAGHVVLRRALAILAEQESLDAELAELRGLESGCLRLGVPPLGNSILFAPLIAEFRKRHPGIKIELREQGSHILNTAIQSGEVEIGASLLPVSASFTFRLIRNEPIMAVLPADHKLAERDSIKLKELSGSQCIYFERGFALNSIISAACNRRSIVLPEATRSGQSDFILALVAAGLGIAMFPRLMVTHQLRQDLKAVLLDEKDLRWKLALIWRTGVPLSPPAQRWLKIVDEKLTGKSGL